MSVSIIDNRNKSDVAKYTVGDYVKVNDSIYVIVFIRNQWVAVNLSGGYLTNPTSTVESLIKVINDEVSELFECKPEFIKGHKVKIEVTIS